MHTFPFFRLRTSFCCDAKGSSTFQISIKTSTIWNRGPFGFQSQVERQAALRGDIRQPDYPMFGISSSGGVDIWRSYAQLGFWFIKFINSLAKCSSGSSLNVLSLCASFRWCCADTCTSVSNMLKWQAIRALQRQRQVQRVPTLHALDPNNFGSPNKTNG